MRFLNVQQDDRIVEIPLPINLIIMSVRKKQEFYSNLKLSFETVVNVMLTKKTDLKYDASKTLIANICFFF